jgi:hypothetical protein
MKVLAAPGLECPMENDPTHRKRIPDSGPGVEVPDDSAFYQRLLADGSLVLYTEAKKSAKSADKTGGQ